MSLPPLPLPLKLLGAARLLVGASSWLLPYHASRVFALLTLPPQTTVILRLFAVRDAMLAGLLLTAGTEAERSRMVMGGVMVDGIDVLASLVGFGLGEQEPEVAGIVGAGAAILMSLGLMGRTG